MADRDAQGREAVTVFRVHLLKGKAEPGAVGRSSLSEQLHAGKDGHAVRRWARFA